ncbi:MAG: quinone oxidoreductase [Beijerinckiaceae bacterium]|nr:quinone oxidoreductase [Beijerinckiaceae bacterium]
MVKAIHVHAHGGPDVLKFDEVSAVEPGEGQVLVRNHAIGLNYIDVYFRSGAYPVPQMPFVPGNEGAGEVLAVGPGVSEFKAGDRVAYPGPLGAYAEQRVLPAAMLVKLPDGVSYEQAATMMLKGLTAEYLLHRTYKVKPGDVILVHAAAGATGQLLVQWGKHLGAIVIATVGSDEKGKIAKSLGADHVINYTNGDFAPAVKEATNGALCHVVYDGVGKTTLLGSLDCLRPFGLLASFGSASGNADPLNIGLLAGKGSLYVTRPTLFTHINNRATYVEMAKNLFDVVASGAVKSEVTNRFALADAAKAHAALESRQTTGATVLIP